MKIKNDKKAISLIVLVITIIVMIVLAGAIILSLNNAGIIGKANEAVQATDEANVKELAQMVWAEAYLKPDKSEEALSIYVIEKLDKAGINTDDYLINVTTKGVTIKLKSKAWIKDGLTVKKGDETLNIGQEINYTATGTDYSGEWRVLGADDNGDLLIMSASDVVPSHKIGYEQTVQTTTEDRLKESQNDWLNGEKELDNMCADYGNGKGAIGARSIKIKDVDSVFGYTIKKPYGEGQVYQHGNEVVYKYSGTSQPSYSSSVVSSGSLRAHNSGFYYYDGTTFKYIPDLTTGTSGSTIVTYTNTYHDYTIKEENPEVIEMIFGKYDESTSAYTASYWLSSRYIYTGNEYIGFGMHSILNGKISNKMLITSDGGVYGFARGVRAVVTLSSEFTLT